MNSIEIQINSIGNNINALIDTINYKININNKEKNITQEQLYELIRIIRNWKSKYEEPKNQIDYETFIIKVNTNEGVDEIIGNGGYPDNYLSLKDWIGDFYE